MKRAVPQIYVVDDSQTVLRHSQFVLESAGYRVQTFASGQTIAETIRREPPDLLILDYILPGQNGLKLAGSLKKEFPWLPIVILTGHGSEEVAAEALRTGVDDYIIKPFLPEIMIHVVQRVLEKRSQTDDCAEKKKLQAVIESVRSAVHSLSQPFTVVYGEAQLALSNLQPGEPLYESLNAIVKQCVQMEEVIDRLRNLLGHGDQQRMEGVSPVDLGQPKDLN